MRIRTTLAVAAVIAGGVAALGAAAWAGDRATDKAAAKLAGMEPTGETLNCISLRSIDDLTAVDEQTFLVRAGGAYYVNRTSSQCHGATRSGNRLQYETTQSQLCSLQIIDVIDNQNDIFSGSCTLGEFEKLAPADSAS